MTGGTWIIFGASSTIAKAFAHEVASRGSAVLLAGRERDDLERSATDLAVRYGIKAQHTIFDAANLSTHGAFVQMCRAACEPPLNVFVAFGLMPEQSEIDQDVALGVQTVTATYTGVVSVLHHFAPLFEDQKEGHVVVLGSVAGDRGRLKNYVYGSAKAGVHTYLQGLRARLWRSGVSVTTVKPGFVDTSMTWGLPGLFLVASPQDCARACLRWAEKGKESGYYPSFWLLIMTIIRTIPERIFKKLSI